MPPEYTRASIVTARRERDRALVPTTYLYTSDAVLMPPPDTRGSRPVQAVVDRRARRKVGVVNVNWSP